MSEEMDWSKKLEEEYRQLQESIKKPNILLAGATGAGKSSLVNMIFGEELAAVGIGKPVTKQIDVYEDNEIDVRIFDSKGYELGEAADKEFYESVVHLAKITNSPEKAIHLIWYCIDCSGHKVTDYDEKAIEIFSKAGIPIAIVLTKADLVSDEEVIALKKALPDSAISNTFETTIDPDCQEYNQVEKLIDWSIEHLDESLRQSFIRSQNASLHTKWEKAHKMVITHTAIAGGVGAASIPFADAPILASNEIGLLVRILYLYNLCSLKDFLKSSGIPALLARFLTTAGKQLVKSILKTIAPGATNVVSAAVAAAITFAFGEATSTLAYQISKARLNGNNDEASKMIKDFWPLLTELINRYISEGRKTKDDYTEENM